MPNQTTSEVYGVSIPVTEAVLTSPTWETKDGYDYKARPHLVPRPFGLQFCKRRRDPGLNSDITFSKTAGNALNVLTTNASYCVFFIFAVFDKAEIDGKTLQYTTTIASNTSDDPLSFHIFDRSWNRSSLSQFPDTNANEVSGATAIQTLESVVGARAQTTSSFTLNLSSCAFNSVTLMIREYESWPSALVNFTLSDIRIKDGDTVLYQWDNTGAFTLESDSVSNYYGTYGSPISLN